VHATVRAFLQTLADFPDESQTLLVEIVGAGPRAMERRDAALASAYPPRAKTAAAAANRRAR
jgi:hypothetical protein